MAKVRIMARAIDMLGRQQIAGIPTAIHELFKNAHDAYADEVRVDYYRSDALLVLRDDGIGMTEEEFNQRWLTVGTDSKLSGGTLPLPIPDGVERPRPVLGEKGIGRLAIATIGPQVMVLTRSKRQQAGNGITAALVNWRLFQLPGISVEDIDVPVISLGPEEGAGVELVQLLREQAILDVGKLRGRAADAELDRIISEIGAFDVDPTTVYSDIGWKTLDANGTQGTHFFIYPADRIIELDMREAEGNETASSLLKSLVGFSNTMTPDAEPPPLLTSFQDHRLDGTVDEVISPGSFWTPDEFSTADHRVSGHFDEDGTFRGEVRVYRGEPVEYTCIRPDTAREPECGPFSFDVAYFQGNLSESKLEQSEFVRINTKLSRIGGIYVYRDGIRILPYGDTEVDFLDIERRRSKSAGYYFFSYRRMFGAVQLSRERNGALVEKAGREGFQQNRAFRDLKQLLENLLVQVAATFFRSAGPQAEDWERTKETLKRLDEVQRTRDKQSKVRRSKLASDLESFFERFDRGEPMIAVGDIVEDAEGRLRVLADMTDKSEAAEGILTLRRETIGAIERVRKRNTVAKPSGVGLNKALTRDWSSYQKRMERFETEILAHATGRLETVIGEVVDAKEIPLDRTRRLVELVQETCSNTQREVGSRSRPLTRKAEAVRDGVVRKVRAAVAAMSAQSQETLAAAIAERVVNEERLDEVGRRLSAELTEVYDTQIVMLDNLDRALDVVLEERDGVNQDELTEALETQIQALREEVDLYLELAQVGMAIGIVQHDFVSAIQTIRQSIRALGPWAAANTELRKIERSLRTSFEHLDGYLNLFTPLNRRLRRSRTAMTGDVVFTFLDSLFAEHFLSDEIRLEATDDFRRYQLEGFPSTFLPVFVNLTDNARYWVQQGEEMPRRVLLDAEGRDLLVRDSGPGVADRDRDAIFDFGFTRKQEGRGLGLFIVRQVLEREGWSISLDASVPGRGANFRLSPLVEQDDGELERQA